MDEGLERTGQRAAEPDGLKVRTVIRAALGSVLGTALAGAILLAVAVVVKGGLSRVDPIGIVLLGLMLAWSVPCAIVGLVVSQLLARHLTETPRWLSIAASIVAAAIASGAAFPMIFVAIGLWQYFVPGAVIPAALSGALTAIIFIALQHVQARGRQYKNG